MTTDQIELPLPPYVYGRECAANEKVWPETAVRDAQRAAVNEARKSNPLFTVEAVVLGLYGEKLRVALVKRSNPNEPDCGKYGLPTGGLDDSDEAGSNEAMIRVLKNTLTLKPSYLEQTFCEVGAKRDPRGWSASAVHLALQSPKALKPLVDAGLVELFDVWPIPDLPANMALDHAELVKEAVRRLSERSLFSTMVAHLLPKVFTLSDLQGAYETVSQSTGNSANFRRKILKAKVLVDEELQHSFGRPAQGYKLRKPISFFDKKII